MNGMKLFLKDFWVNYTEENKYKTGIYKIYHINCIDKLYIGSASGISKYGGLANRLRRHLKDLELNSHCNKKLQYYINKYGIDGIRFETIEFCNKDNCLKFEQKYIDLLNPYFNIARTAGNTLGVRPTLEQIIKVSKPILQYDLDGNFITDHINSTFASEYSGIAKTLIAQCCTGANNTIQSGGFQWRCKLDNNFPLKIDKYYMPTAFRLICYKNTGEFVAEFISLLEASIKLNIPTGNISHHLDGQTAVCYKYVFKHHTENYPMQIEPVERMHKNQIKVIIKDLETNVITEYQSFRSLTPGLIGRQTLGLRYKNNLLNFIFKDKYEVTLEKCK
jgi:group I intron endonuclease